MEKTFFWYDFETFGRDPMRLRPVQFAGIRTTLDLEPIGEPISLLCKPTPDFLPHPDACLVHGISPLQALRKGLPEGEFAERIQREMTRPGTCNVGYNAMAFDHTATQFLFYRTLREPYTWHYQDGCTRWDIIDLLRAAYALRPEGLSFPTNGDGKPSFRLEDIAPANGVELNNAHDALCDVRATIGMARRVKEEQPRLFDYYYSLREKRNVGKVIAPSEPSAVLHVAPFYSAESRYATLVWPVATSPTNGNAVIAFDLARDPETMLSLSVEELQHRMFTPADDLPDEIERPGLTTIKRNKSPFVVRLNGNRDRVLDQIGLDQALFDERVRTLTGTSGLLDKVRDVYDRAFVHEDVDHQLYDGFIKDGDRRTLQRLLDLPPADFLGAAPSFEDDRLPELVERFGARNYYEHLAPGRKDAWRGACRGRLSRRRAYGFADYDRDIANRKAESSDASEHTLLEEMRAYGEQVNAWIEGGSYPA